MSLIETARKFGSLKRTVQQDGRVDLVEANALLDFVSAHNRTGAFSKLRQILSDVVRDGSVSEAESRTLTWLLDDAERYLRTKVVSEAVIACVLVVSAAVAVCACL